MNNGTTTRVYAYLRASTEEQDAQRGRMELADFAATHGVEISAWFIENVSGAKLERPELMKLIEVAERGDVLLVERVNRLSRLTALDWEKLKSRIIQGGLRVVALDLPTSHVSVGSSGDEFTDRIQAALNGMMLDMLAAMARKEYEDRQYFQAQGIAKAKQIPGKYRGRPKNTKLHDEIEEHLRLGRSYGKICKTLGCSRKTVALVKKERFPEGWTFGVDTVREG